MNIERMLREQAYKHKRKRHVHNQKNMRHVRSKEVIDSDIKKIIGLVLITFGILLLLSRCGTNTQASEKNTESVKETAAQATTNPYLSYIQDFNISPTQLEKLFKISFKQKKPISEVLAVWIIENSKGTNQNKINKMIKKYSPTKNISEYGIYEDAANIYDQFIYDIEYFPIPSASDYAFENGWKEGRVFKGNRKHYGIDIMDMKNKPGSIKVVSMTSGVVENVGWNEVGGYRVGIRSQGGAYFYYAHLNENPTHIKKGDRVNAGDVIGMMGNTGYGPEGTRGKFQTHLHVGIAVTTKEDKEFWINPYYLLKYYENNKVSIGL